MKKYFALCLSIIMVFVALLACATEDTPDNTTNSQNYFTTTAPAETTSPTNSAVISRVGFPELGEDGSLEYIIKKSTDILKSPTAAKEVSETIKVIDRDLIYSYINIMTVLAEYITSENKLFSYSDQLPQLIMDYIHNNISSKITLSILSQKFGCCNSTLAKCFKK